MYKRRTLYSIPSIIILLFLAFVLSRGAIKILAKEKESYDRLETLREEASAMSARRETLKKDIERLATPEGMEEEIKNKFSAVGEGEHVAIIVNDKRLASSTADTEVSWYKKIFRAIMRIKQ